MLALRGLVLSNLNVECLCELEVEKGDEVQQIQPKDESEFEFPQELAILE